MQWNGRRYSESGDVPAVTAPSGLSATTSTTTINLSWTNGEATASTVVERSNNGAGGWITIATKAAGVTSHADTSLAVGTYYYRVSHLINSVASSVSSNANATVASGGGSVADGDSVTKTITGGGANVAAANQSFLGGYNGTVESATVGAQFTTFRPANWSQAGAAHGPICSNTRSLNGTKSLLNDTVNGQYAFAMRYDFTASRYVQFGWFSYYLDKPNAVNGQLKLCRTVGDIASTGGIHDANQPNHYITYFHPDAGGNGEYMPVNNSSLGGSNINVYASSESGTYYAEGVWVTCEYVSTYNSTTSASDGEVILVARRQDTGAILGTYTWSNVRLDYDGANRARWFLIQMYMGNGLADGSTKLYIDRDVYVSCSTTSTKPKYILLGNASTYAACTKLTICEYTAWTQNGSDADVTFRVNKGQHASLSGLYVYGMSGPNTPINSTGVAL